MVQTAAKLVLEPIFEADFLPVSHGFRPRRSAHDALGAVQEGLERGLTAVYDADLKGYFDRFHGADGPTQFAGARLVRLRR